MIIFYTVLTGGTKHAHDFCLKKGKPHVLIDAERLSIDQASNKIRQFIERNQIFTLNVAGPRGSENAEAYGYSRMVILSVIQ